MKKIYLTIDDSPSTQTDALTDFLLQQKIPAVLFVRGALMEEKPPYDRIVRAIGKGFLIGNHSYAHERSSQIGFAAQTLQIERTQDMIDRAYRDAGMAQPVRTFRFPHLDRGAGNAHVIDFSTVPENDRDFVEYLFRDGVRLENNTPPTDEQIRLKHDMQNWLRENGFIALPTPDVTFPWYVQSELGTAIDTLITYSTSDWMILPRHTGKWPYKNIDDLKHKMDTDSALQSDESANIVLMHDYGEEESLTHFQELIMYFLNQNFIFLKF